MHSLSAVEAELEKDLEAGMMSKTERRAPHISLKGKSVEWVGFWNALLVLGESQTLPPCQLCASFSTWSKTIALFLKVNSAYFSALWKGQVNSSFERSLK